MEKKDIFNMNKSFAAVIFGFVTAFLIARLANPSAFSILSKAIFVEPFAKEYIFDLEKLFSIYIIVGLAVLVSFKAKLFNIGVPGQMLAGAIIPTMLSTVSLSSSNIPGLWLVFLLIGLFVGAFVGGLAGYLKAKFNVHEVIGTIMLNWIIYYIGKAVFATKKYKSASALGSKIWNPQHQVAPIFTLIIAIILICFVWYLFKKTRFGYKIKLVGSQRDVADYAGYSREKIQTITMAISGGFAGLAGVIYYGTYSSQYLIPVFDSLDPIGFNAIVVALVAFLNPILIAPIALIFATIHFGGYIATVNFESSVELISLAFGLMMYMIAITENVKYKKRKKKLGVVK